MSNEEMKNRHSTIVGLLSLLLLVVAFGGTSLICHVQKNKKEDKPAELCENAIKVEGNKVGVCRDEAFGYTNEEQNKISVVGYGFGNHEDGWEYSDERQTTFDGTYDWYDFADADPGTYRFTFRSSDGDWADLDCPVSSEHCHRDEMGSFSICMTVKDNRLETASLTDCDQS